ncbi:MAG: protein kinase [Candidatus Gastranaerophilales bacterium]|nr:protein kinase [Candidatus Gastranaerophilales bacterium]
MSGIDANDPKPGMRINGKFGTYKLVEKLGDGGNGVVYSVEVISAENELLRKEKLAIKILTVRSYKYRERKKREERFQKEIQYICQIQDEVEGIIPIYDASSFLEECGYLDWYIMPKASKYYFWKSYTTEEKLKDMRSLGECIAQLHAKGLAHRDIKPRNLLVYKNRVCLSDFGLVWNMDEKKYHITDIQDSMGPIATRPPEMRSVEDLAGIDYRKSDVYLFVKTVWIILTGVKEGFSGEYNRSKKSIYLDREKLRLETAEPLHLMLKSATEYYWRDRIDIGKCIQYIDEQLDIIARRASDVDISRWKYEETAKEISETISADAQIYQDTYSIQEILEKMAGMVNLIFEETGKTYDPMLLKGAKILSDNLFELEIKNAYYNNRRKIVVDIEKIFMKKDLSCVMYIRGVTGQFDNIPIFTNLKEALQSMDKQICISGTYSVQLAQFK